MTLELGVIVESDRGWHAGDKGDMHSKSTIPSTSAELTADLPVLASITTSGEAKKKPRPPTESANHVDDDTFTKPGPAYAPEPADRELTQFSAFEFSPKSLNDFVHHQASMSPTIIYDANQIQIPRIWYYHKVQWLQIMAAVLDKWALKQSVKSNKTWAYDMMGRFIGPVPWNFVVRFHIMRSVNFVI